MDATEIISTIRFLYMRDRTIVCDDYDISLQYLQRLLDFEILEYSSGDTYWNWIVPDKYTVNKAYIEIVSTGVKVIDVANHPLHLASYSAAFDGNLSFKELLCKLSWHDQLPDAIPYYYKLQYRPWVQDWRFCLSKNQLDSLNAEDSYRVVIDTQRTPGTMKVGRRIKKGKSEDTILLISHLDHPGQVNDGLSGVAVMIALMQEINRLDTYYSYELLILPEFFGSVAYLSSLKSYSHYTMGIFTEMLSTGLPLILQQSLTGSTYIDDVANMYFRQQLPNSEIVKYLEAVGNDEIVFESPGVEIPFISVTRARQNGHMYPEYHTSLDNADLLDEAQLSESYDHLLHLLKTIEMDAYPMRTFDGFLCLSNPEVDLYFNVDDLSSDGTRLDPRANQRFHDFQFGGFRYLDGRHRISEIATKYDLSFDMLNSYLKRMHEKGLVTFSMERANG